jgi:hypothetical protein
LWQQYGLFTLSGADARHGGGKKDLAMLMLYSAADRYLKDGGRLGLVITQSVFQTKGAGDGFRRFRLGRDGPCLRVLRVNDLAHFQPFSPAANWTATITLEKGSPTVYPVPYTRWTRPVGVSAGKQTVLADAVERREYSAEPIDPKRSTSPWFIRPPGLRVPLGRLIGPSDYRAHLGANTGGANGVYWLRLVGPAKGGIRVRNLPGKGKTEVPQVEATIEPDLLYPLLRWRDVSRFNAVDKGHLLLVQDIQTRRGIDEPVLRRRYPQTYQYLRQFRPQLAARAAYRRYQHKAPFYSMYDVARYTVAPIKVVWRRMDRRLNAAVVQEVDDPLLGLRPVVPQETCVLIAAGTLTEAHYSCAVLNSAVASFLVASHSVRGGKSFGTPSMLDFTRLRRFDPGNPLHVELADLSRQAHQIARQGTDLEDIQNLIDCAAARLWNLSDEETRIIRRELDG